jgi:hypothetical protein
MLTPFLSFQTCLKALSNIPARAFPIYNVSTVRFLPTLFSGKNLMRSMFVLLAALQVPSNFSRQLLLLAPFLADLASKEEDILLPRQTSKSEPESSFISTVDA